MITPKVLHVTTLDISIRFLLLDFLTYLKKQDYDVSGMSAPGPWVKDIETAGIRHFAVDFERSISPWRDIIVLGQMVRLFRREKFDIVHSHTPKAILLGQIAAWLARVPCRVTTVHGFHFHDLTPKWQRRFYVSLEKISSYCAHWIFSQNREDIATAIREKISPPGKLHYLGNGINIEYFRRDRHGAAADALRREIGIPAGAPVVGMVARLMLEKGYREFVEAAALIHAQRPDVHFVAVGPEYTLPRAELVGLIKASPVAPQIHFQGTQVEMPKYYAIMSLIAHPTYHWEGMPRVLIEAAAMSLPAVATDVRGCREIVESGRTGLLVPARDSRRLAEAILVLLNDPDRAQAFGHSARLKAEREFDERIIFARMTDAYTQLLGSLNARG